MVLARAGSRGSSPGNDEHRHANVQRRTIARSVKGFLVCRFRRRPERTDGPGEPAWPGREGAQQEFVVIGRITAADAISQPSPIDLPSTTSPSRSVDLRPGVLPFRMSKTRNRSSISNDPSNLPDWLNTRQYFVENGGRVAGAGAVVTDLSSPRLARIDLRPRYGIPAVVGCGDATARLRDGMRVVGPQSGGPGAEAATARGPFP